MNAPPKAAAPPGREGGVTEIKGGIQKHPLDKPLSPEVQDILARAQQREEEQYFDWGQDDSIAVRSQPTTAVYCNKLGQVVIRQERAWDEEEDTFVYISRENVLSIVRAILVNGGYEDAQLYGQTRGGCYDIDWPEGPFSQREVAMMNARPDIDWKAVHDDADAAGLIEEDTVAAGKCRDLVPKENQVDKPKDPTAAERQRRRRRKQRDANRDTVTVTPNGHDLLEQMGA